MKINYCLPIIKSSVSEVKKEIEENKMNYQYFEIWLDYIQDLNIEFIEQLKKDLQKKVIFLFRRKNLESINMDIQKRKKIVDSLENSESFLDLDIETQREELEYIKGKNIKTVLSYHNYKKTPPTELLNEFLEKMKEYDPSIYKISTFCETTNDAIRLLDLLANLKEKKLKVVILGMGEEGVITRIFGTLWGNEMIFAPLVKDEATAPGQLTKDELERILLELE